MEDEGGDMGVCSVATSNPGRDLKGGAHGLDCETETAVVQLTAYCLVEFIPDPSAYPLLYTIDSG